MRRALDRTLAPLVLLGCLLAGCGDTQRPPEAAEPRAGAESAAAAAPVEDVRAEFEAICRQLMDSDGAYHGLRPLQRLEQQLADPDLNETDAISVRTDLGRELLKHGRAREAVEMVTEALNLARQQGADDRLRLPAAYTLALAHLRAGEDDNCVLHHTAASCIVPISAEGVHRRPEHARRAGDLLQELVDSLEMLPDQLTARWLLNIARMVSGDYPEDVPLPLRLPPGAFTSAVPFEPWRDRAMLLGVDVVDLAGGAVMDDFDGDGLLDLVTSTSDPCGSLKAFRNDAAGGFEDVTAAWGLDSQRGGLNMIHADYDNDGRLDLLVLRGGWLHERGRIRNSLLRNELDGAGGGFRDVTRASGMGQVASPTQTAAWADFDGDGDLDLYVGNEEEAEAPHPSSLYRNEGNGTFTEVARSAGVTNERYAKAVTWGDYDDDGDPDLYVSNIGPNRMYRNEGNGTFTDVAVELGLTEPRGRGFTNWFFDYDNDGDLDLFVADYNADPALVFLSYFGTEVSMGQPLLYRNDGGRFTEVSRQMGLERPLLPMGANFGDLDNDGWLDFYLGTGDPSYSSVMPNVMYRNEEGQRFVDVTFAGRFGHLQKGHGVAFGDLDNDGDQDLFHQLGGFYPGDAFANALFVNPGAQASWINLRLVGRRANRFGVGARIAVRVLGRDGRARSIHALVGSGGSFGGSSYQQEIGLGRVRAIEEIEVRWPGSGTVQRFRDVDPDRTYRVIEGEPDLVPVELAPIALRGTRQSRTTRRGGHPAGGDR